MEEKLSERSKQWQQQIDKKLSSIGERDFTYDDINKMTLWKVQRYPCITEEALNALNKLTFLKGLEKESDIKIAKNAIRLLLQCHGVRLPMASTYLRFRNPKVFQIIDRHVWFQVEHDDTYRYEKRKSEDEAIDDYFDYLKKLREICNHKNKEFINADKVLYWTDKEEKHKISK